MAHFSPLEIFFSHLLLLCSTLYHPLLSLVRLKVALHALYIVISRLTSSRLVCPDPVFSFFLSVFFFLLFFFSFLAFCTLFISSLYLFSLPRNFFTLVFIVYYLASLVKHINKQASKQTLKLGLRSFVFQDQVALLMLLKKRAAKKKAAAANRGSKPKKADGAEAAASNGASNGASAWNGGMAALKFSERSCTCVLWSHSVSRDLHIDNFSM